MITLPWALAMALLTELRSAEQNCPLEENSLPCKTFLQNESSKTFAGLYQAVPWHIFQKESEASDGIHRRDEGPPNT